MRSFASLRRTADFSRLRQRGRRTATANLAFYRADGASHDERPLVGITVSKNVGNAVVRNRLRRRLSALLQELLDPATRMRLLIVARPSAAQPLVRRSVRRSAPGPRLMRPAIVFGLRAYKRLISPLLPPACRFYPTCSEYAAQAIAKHGLARGGILAAKRLVKCTPLHPGGFDPVPER